MTGVALGIAPFISKQPSKTPEPSLVADGRIEELRAEEIAKIDLFTYAQLKPDDQLPSQAVDSWSILNQNADIEIVEVIFERRFVGGPNLFDDGPRYFSASIRAMPFSFSAPLPVDMGMYNRETHKITVRRGVSDANAKQPNKAPEPTTTAVTPRAIE